MSQAVELFEVDVPYCSLTYGVLPCRAVLNSIGAAGAAFDGTNYLRSAAAMTGAADSKLLSFSVWINKHNAALGGRIVCPARTAGGAEADTTRLISSTISPGRIGVVGQDAAAAGAITIESSVDPVAGQWEHYCGMIDTAASGNCKMYRNGVDVTSITVAPTNVAMDFTYLDWAIGARPDGSLKLDADLAELWFAPGQWINFSIAANREKFRSSGGAPVTLGSNGSTPTGTAPLIYLGGTDFATWHTNKGTGGGFTANGTLVAATFGGPAKCFNTLATCQDTESIDLDEPATLRFAKGADYLPRELDLLPWIKSLDFTPSTVSLGENLGTRATLKVTLSDHPHSDTGIDKYVQERDYDPYEQGSFWPKFRARLVSLQGVGCRWKIGFADIDFELYETRHFFIESFDGPASDGGFTFYAKDALQFLDGDRAQAPALSTGAMQGALTTSTTSLTLLPAGVGALEYPASGYVRLGGREDAAFTRVGDVLTLTRAQLGTEASAHSAGDRVQLVLRYTAQDPANIAHHVLTTYTDLPPSYIPLSEWQAEISANLGTLYTFTYGEPTPVKTILSRLMEQAGLAIWDDPLAQILRLKVIQAVPITSVTVDESRVIAKSFNQADQPTKRASQVWVYYSLNDPTKKFDDLDNYRSVAKVVDLDSEEIYGQEAIRKVFASGIATGGATIANRIGNIIAGRYKTPPRLFKFKQFRGTVAPELGEGCNIGWQSLQDATGAREIVPAQVTRVKPHATMIELEAEEMRYDYSGPDPTIHVVTIDFNTNNLNIRSLHDALYGAPVAGDKVIFYVLAGVVVGSASTGLYALTVGSFPAGVTVNVVILGRVQGMGGQGGGYTGANGFVGGPALATSGQAINLVVTGGQVWSGGGGGGGTHYVNFNTWMAGGGGAGTLGGPAGAHNFGGTGTAAQAGSSTAGGAGFLEASGLRAGNGGGPGLAGGTGVGVSGGAVTFTAYAGSGPGNAIVGVSSVTRGTWNASTLTFTATGSSADGDIRGPQI